MYDPFLGVLQCVVVCCSVSQSVAERRSWLQCVAGTEAPARSEDARLFPWCAAVCCSVLQCVAVCCSVLQSVAVCRNV